MDVALAVLAVIVVVASPYYTDCHLNLEGNQSQVPLMLSRCRAGCGLTKA